MKFQLHHRATMPAVLAASIALALGLSLPVHAQYHYPAPGSSSTRHMANSIHPIRARSPESPVGMGDRFGQNPNPSIRSGEAVPRAPINQTSGTQPVIYGAVPPDPDAVPGEPPVVGGHHGRNGTSTGAMGAAGYAHTLNSAPRRTNSPHRQLNPSVEGYRYGETPAAAQPARGKTPVNAMHTLQTGSPVRTRVPVNANLRQPQSGSPSGYGHGHQGYGNQNDNGQQQGYGDTGAQASHGGGNHHGGHHGNGHHDADDDGNGWRSSAAGTHAGDQGRRADNQHENGDSSVAYPNGGHHHGGEKREAEHAGHGGGGHHGSHGNHAGQGNDHHGGQTTSRSGQTGTTPGSSPSGQQPHGIGSVPTVHPNGSIDPGYGRAHPTSPPSTPPLHVQAPSFTRIPQANPTQSQHGSHPNVPLQSNVPMTSLTPRQQLQTPPPATPAQATPAHLPTGAHQGLPMQSNVTMPAPRQRVQLPSPVPASSAGHGVPAGVQIVPVSPVNPNILIKPKAKALGVQHLQHNSTLGAPAGGGG